MLENKNKYSEPCGIGDGIRITYMNTRLKERDNLVVGRFDQKLLELGESVKIVLKPNSIDKDKKNKEGLIH